MPKGDIIVWAASGAIVGAFVVIVAGLKAWIGRLFKKDDDKRPPNL
jgi:hypothetical protein